MLQAHVAAGGGHERHGLGEGLHVTQAGFAEFKAWPRVEQLPRTSSAASYRGAAPGNRVMISQARRFPVLHLRRAQPEPAILRRCPPVMLLEVVRPTGARQETALIACSALASQGSLFMRCG